MDILESFLKEKEKTKPTYTPGINRRVKRLDSPPERHEPVWQSLDEFRRTVATSMREYMAIQEPEHMLLIPSPPGSGKTWAGVDFAHWVYAQNKRRVLYAGPRRTFFEDVVFTSVRQNKDSAMWYDWKPRQENDDDPALHTCNHSDNINQWLSMGYEGMDFCSVVCGWDYVNEGCPYHAQKERREPLIYGHHLHVTLGHPLAKEFAVVIGDELPLAAFVHEWTIPASRIQVRGVAYDSSLAPILHELGRLCEMKPQLLQGAPLIEALGGAATIIEAIDDAVLAMFASAIIQPPTVNKTGDVSFVPANYLPTFLPILRREAEAVQAGREYPHRLLVDGRGLTILTRRSVNEQMPAHMIWFDATGSASLYTAMFDRDVRILDAQPRPAGRVFQVTERGNGKGSVLQKTEDGISETAKAAQLRMQIDHICQDYSNPGVISHMALEESIVQETRHFYGSRGTNDFQECDVLIVAGTPMPPIYQIDKQARCLWAERMRPFDQTMLTVDRAYQFVGDDGAGYSYPVSQFADPDLNILLEQYREFEIVQAAHRSRMLFRETDVYLLTNIPIDRLPIFRLLTIRELLDAPEGVNVHKWRQVVDFANKHEFVTAADLVTTVGISLRAATMYLTVFVAEHGWEWVEGIRKPGARGPAPKIITKNQTPTRYRNEALDAVETLQKHNKYLL